MILASAITTQGLVTWLQALIAPLFLGVVGIMALFFLFKKEITKFAEFVLLAVAVAVVFYWPVTIQMFASALAKALGVH